MVDDLADVLDGGISQVVAPREAVELVERFEPELRFKRVADLRPGRWLPPDVYSCSRIAGDYPSCQGEPQDQQRGHEHRQSPPRAQVEHGTHGPVSVLGRSWSTDTAGRVRSSSALS